MAMPQGIKERDDIQARAPEAESLKPRGWATGEHFSWTYVTTTHRCSCCEIDFSPG
jgi:hypothetical protein